MKHGCDVAGSMPVIGHPASNLSLGRLNLLGKLFGVGMSDGGCKFEGRIIRNSLTPDSDRPSTMYRANRH